MYNVVYSGSDDNYVLYTSMPGGVVTLSRSTPDGVTNSDLTFLDASTPASTQPLKAPNGHTFVPTSPLQPVGVNGLPPREVQFQGYQQFDVFDSTGVRIGSVDADVFTQWDLLGIRSEALLITKVTEGTAGTGAGDVAPVGSVFNFVDFGNGFGIGQIRHAHADERCEQVRTHDAARRYPPSPRHHTDPAPHDRHLLTAPRN